MGTNVSKLIGAESASSVSTPASSKFVPLDLLDDAFDGPFDVFVFSGGMLYQLLTNSKYLSKTKEHNMNAQRGLFNRFLLPLLSRTVEGLKVMP